jgi:hypothetical protein
MHSAGIFDFFGSAGRAVRRSADPHFAGGFTAFVEGERMASGVVSA